MQLSIFSNSFCSTKNLSASEKLELINRAEAIQFNSDSVLNTIKEYNTLAGKCWNVNEDSEITGITVDLSYDQNEFLVEIYIPTSLFKNETRHVTIEVLDVFEALSNDRDFHLTDADEYKLGDGKTSDYYALGDSNYFFRLM